jgi:hypothetical protein
MRIHINIYIFIYAYQIYTYPKIYVYIYVHIYVYIHFNSILFWLITTNNYTLEEINPWGYDKNETAVT